MHQNSKASKSRKQPRNPVRPKSGPVVQRPKSSIGRVVDAGVGLARKVPVLNNVVDTVETVASSLLSFFGLSDAFTIVHTMDGKVRFVPRRPVAGLALSNGSAQPGDILLKHELSVGPDGSRPRIISQCYEKYRIPTVSLQVDATAAATENGQIAYLYVPDPSDLSIELMGTESRLASVLARENVQVYQIWQSGVLSFRIPPREYFVDKGEDARLASPGSIYIIALTAVNTDKLPTIRSTCKYTFMKPTLNPSGLSHVYGTVNLGVSCIDAEDDRTEMKLYHEAKNSVLADRIMSVQVTGFNPSGSGEVTADLVRMEKGEVMEYDIHCTATQESGETKLVIGTPDYFAMPLIFPESSVSSGILAYTAQSYSSVTMYGRTDGSVDDSTFYHDASCKYTYVAPATCYIFFVAHKESYEQFPSPSALVPTASMADVQASSKYGSGMFINMRGGSLRITKDTAAPSPQSYVRELVDEKTAQYAYRLVPKPTQSHTRSKRRAEEQPVLVEAPRPSVPHAALSLDTKSSVVPTPRRP